MRAPGTARLILLASNLSGPSSTNTRQKYEVGLGTARIEGSKTCASLNSRLESKEKEEDDQPVSGAKLTCCVCSTPFPKETPPPQAHTVAYAKDYIVVSRGGGGFLAHNLCRFRAWSLRFEPYTPHLSQASRITGNHHVRHHGQSSHPTPRPTSRIMSITSTSVPPPAMSARRSVPHHHKVGHESEDGEGSPEAGAERPCAVFRAE